MKKAIPFLLLSFSVLFFCCKQKKEQKSGNPFAPQLVEAHGYVVPKDSMAEPKSVPAGIPKVVKAGQPKVVLTNTNVHPAGIPKVVMAGTPRICTPGQDSFLLPKTVPAIDSPYPAGIPEVVLAKDAHVSDDNPYSFSSFGELQGLKSNRVRCMIQDREGNLWFGGYPGVAKYDGKSFTIFTEKQGLSSNAIECVLQDKSGNVWCSVADDGVYKYNGLSFTHFTPKEGLCSKRINSILLDKSGNIWFGSSNHGVSKYDGKSFTNFTQKEGLCNDCVWSILQDKSENIWFGTDGGVSKYDGKSFINYTSKEGLCGRDIISILQDKNGNLWFGSDDSGVCKYDGKTFTRFTENEGLCNNNIRSMFQDKNGTIWFGTTNGACSYDGTSFTHFSKKEGLSNSKVVCILQDKSGNIWFAGEYGVCKYCRQPFSHFAISKVKTILQDKNGNLWFGTIFDGLYKYNKSSDKDLKMMYGTIFDGVFKYSGVLNHYTEKEGLINNTVECILQDKIGNIWFGTDNGIYRYDGESFIHFTEKEGLIYNVIKSILQDKDGNIWFGTWQGISKYDGKTFINFTKKEGLSNNAIHSILQDKGGNYWFGSDSGVTKYDGKSFTQFTEKQGLRNISNNYVNSILQDKNGNIWFGTDSGVSRYDGASFIHFTEKAGLGSNYIIGMLQDKNGNIWFGTSQGLSKLSQKSLDKVLKNPGSYNEDGPPLFKNYTYDDGFLGIHCTGGMYEDNAGTIWVGTWDRLTAFHPIGDDDDTIPPNIQLTGISLFNENIPWTYLLHKQDSVLTLGNGVAVGNFKFDSVSRWYGAPEGLNLAYNNNYLTFNFIGITTSSPKKVKYKYTLDGIDGNWSALTSSTEAPYGNLPQGTYTFRVKARNGDGYWSHEYRYTFTIRPPWWKTWWAYTLYALIALGSIVVFVRWRTASLLRRQKELEDTVDERTAEVVAEKKEVEKQYQRSEELLLNILPSEVAEELKANGSAAAKTFDDVTVLFTDFKDFTSISEKLSASDLVAEIHYCFKGFDAIIGRYNIEKIKTIGDSYMAAGGLPVKNKTHAADVVHAAIEIRDFMEAHKQQRIAAGKEVFEIRIGIHTGPVVAGIVGVKKFAYDIWGDTVNTASRMESSGEAGKVNISAATYDLVKDKFTCVYRGKVEAKKKGMVDMYFVENPHPASPEGR